MLDPRTHAVRPDIADVRLAERVFAPHYAAPMARRVRTGCALRTGPDADAPAHASLVPDESFEVLDIAGPNAWGIAVSTGLVGYVEVAALEGTGS